MAERRMFAKTIIDSDAFLEMPISSQCLYFHLSMRADDEGFINKPKTIMRMIGAKDDDMHVLVARKFIIPFETGVVVIKHWKIHNYIRNDRLHETKYQDEKARLLTDENNSYTLCQTSDGQLVDSCPTEVRLGKDRLGKVSIGKDNTTKKEKHKYGEFSHVLLTDNEYTKLINDFGNSIALQSITYLDEYIEMKGTKYKSHYMAIRKWVIDAIKKKGNSSNYKNNQPSSMDNLKKLYEEAALEDEQEGNNSTTNSYGFQL